MRAFALAAALSCLGPPRLEALQILRLPWIFSDEPEIAADFNFSQASGGKTRVELSLGGRFSRFGLPRGAARAPILEILCEFVSPGELVGRVAELKGRVDLGEVLAGYGENFSRSSFSSGAPFVFKTEFGVSLAPGDYNVVVAIRDKELSVSSRRTLHLIVPELRPAQGIGDLKFCLGLGETLDSSGKTRRTLDPNPWRQLGGASGWELIVAYDCLGPATAPGLLRRHSIRRLRNDGDAALWSEESSLPKKERGQLHLARLGSAELKKLSRGIYLFKVEVWRPGQEPRAWQGSKTFEVLP